MTVAASTRYEAEHLLTTWLDMGGVPQLHDWEIPNFDLRGYADLARCRADHPAAVDPDLFFPDSPDSPETYVAQQFCAGCPVRHLCADTARENKLPGIWGGIWRDDKGDVHPLCVDYVNGCRRFASARDGRCRQCSEAKRRLERNAKRRAEYASAERTNAGPVMPGSPAALVGMLAA